MASYKKVIWLVDDDSEDQFLVQQAFSAINPLVVVETLDDGDEVIPALQSSQSLPTLILLDLNMVRMDGFETLIALRNCLNCKPIPVVVLTTSNNPKDQERSEKLGAIAYYTKPFQYQEMLDIANQLVTRWLQ